MPKPQLLSLALTLFVTTVCAAEPARFTPADPEPDSTRYELQVITAKPGKLDALHAWFQAHQDDVLAKHGATNIGYFTPAGENPDRKILCLLRFPSLEAVLKFSRAVKADPLWRPFDTDLGPDNPEVLVEKVEITHLRPTTFSPVFEPSQSSQPWVFELRTYNCPTPEKLIRLHDRFREHTMGLFAKHGMENLVYWQPLDGENSDRQLVYLLAHKSREAAKESFTKFRADPEWLKAKQESEEQAGGSLTNAENGVISEFLEATEYSPLK
jgi:hypothetical protein